MTATLAARNLTGGHAHRTLFESLDLALAPGDGIGVVGANGGGKTTCSESSSGTRTSSAAHVTFGDQWR